RQAEYRSARRHLKRCIRESKRKCFLELCDAADRDPFGKAYQIVVKRVYAGRQRAPSDPGELQNIVETLFPSASNSVEMPSIRDDGPSYADVSAEDIVNAATSLKANKAPGPDGWT
ncbi:hypothetical protein KR222_005718, partial [Zaprionus bogoriensis]